MARIDRDVKVMRCDDRVRGSLIALGKQRIQ
jgi:hypothetical protein